MTQPAPRVPKRLNCARSHFRRVLCSTFSKARFNCLLIGQSVFSTSSTAAAASWQPLNLPGDNTGSPLPNVTWMHENTMLQSDSVVLSDKRVKNVLHLERLQRGHLHRVLTCQAANNNVTEPITSAVTLDLNRKSLASLIS